MTGEIIPEANELSPFWSTVLYQFQEAEYRMLHTVPGTPEFEEAERLLPGLEQLIRDELAATAGASPVLEHMATHEDRSMRLGLNGLTLKMWAQSPETVIATWNKLLHDEDPEVRRDVMSMMWGRVNCGYDFDSTWWNEDIHPLTDEQRETLSEMMSSAVNKLLVQSGPES